MPASPLHSKKFDTVAAWIALAAYAAITIPLAWVLNVGQDDAYTLHTTGGSLAYAFTQAITFEQNAPLYFVVLTLWRHANESFVFARLFSLLCAAAAVALVPAIARRYLPRLPAGAVTLVVALNPFLIWSALEIRVYALVILLSALVFVFYYDAFIANPPRRSSAWLYAITCIAGAYAQYYLLFIVAAQGLALLVVRRQRFAAYAATQAATLVAFIPMIYVVRQQAQQFRSPYSAPTLPVTIKTLAMILATYVLPLNRLPYGHALYVLAAIVVIAAAAASRRVWQRAGDGLSIAVFGLSAALFALVLYAAKVPISTRHPAALFLPAVLATFGVFAFLRPAARSRALLTFTGVLVVVEGAALFAAYHRLAQPGDWARLSAYVEQRERPREPIIVFEAENALPFSYYYHGRNRVVPIPEGIDFRIYDLRRFVLRSPAQLESVLAALPSPRIWLVTGDQCHDMDVEFGCDVLERYVHGHFVLIEQRAFYESNARLLLRRTKSRAPRRVERASENKVHNS